MIQPQNNELRDQLKKYVRVTEDGAKVGRYICPVEGCDFTTRLGPGALRMHLILKADPTKLNRYCAAHEAFCNSHQQDLGLDNIRCLATLPRIEFKTS